MRTKLRRWGKKILPFALFILLAEAAIHTQMPVAARGGLQRWGTLSLSLSSALAVALLVWFLIRRGEVLQRRNRELAFRNEVGQAIISTLDLEEVLTLLMSRVTAALGAEAASVALVEGNEIVFVAAAGEGAPQVKGLRLALGQGIAGWVAQHGQTLLAPNVAQDKRFYPQVDQMSGFTTRSILCVPLKLQEQVIGVIEVLNKVEGEFTEDDRRLLEALAPTAAVAIDKARLFAAERARQARLQELALAIQHITSELDLDAALKQVVEQAMKVLEAERGALFLLDEEADVLLCAYAQGLSDEYIEFINTQYRKVPGSRILETGQPVHVIDAWTDPRTAAARQIMCREGFHTYVVFPLVQRGQTTGALVLYRNEIRPFSAEILALGQTFAHQAAIAIENARLFEETQRRLQEQMVLQEATVTILSTLDPAQILHRLAQQMAQAVGATSAYICDLDLERNTTTVLAEHVSPEACAREQVSDLGVTYSLKEWVQYADALFKGQPVVLTISDPSIPSTDREHMLQFGAQTVLMVPLLVKDELIGYVEVWESHRERVFTPQEIALCQSIANQAAVALEHARLYARLREAKEFNETLVQSMNEGLLLEDEQGYITFVNPRLAEMLGYTREELSGRYWVEIVPSAYVQKISEETAKRPRGVASRYEAALLSKDGQEIPVLISARPLFSGDQYIGTLSVFTDISERKRLEEQLRQAQKMEAIGTLAGGIAHDFNNILGGILGFASFVHQELPADSPLRADVETIINSARRAADLTNQLLAFARRGKYQVQAVNLNGIVDEVVRLLSRTVDKAIAIETNLAADLPAVEGDAGQLQQMLLNLCLNARDAMPAGGVLTIETRQCPLEEKAAEVLNLPAGPYVLLQVTDTGVGMDTATKERIFEPFFTTKHGQPGEKHTGLGLAMVYGIVRNHGGAIEVESELGQGSVFRVYLPASSQTVETQIARQEALLGGQETVLIVDDEEIIRYMLRRALTRYGYTVLLAEDGTQAVEIYRQRAEEIDLVILDMIMPGLGGKDTYVRLREINPQVKVLLTSGYSQEGQAQEILDIGAMGFLQKPYDLPTVLRRVREALDGR